MKRNDIKQANDLVTIKVIGSGLNAWAYFVSDEIYEIISKNKDEDDPIEIITNEVNESALVCFGIDIDSDFEIFAEMSGEHVPLRAVSTYEGFDMADAISDLSIDQSEALIECNTDESTSLGEDLNLDATNHVLIECISWGSIKLSTTLPVRADQFDMSTLRLLVCDLDVETSLSQITYANGLLDDMEKDVIGVKYDEKTFLFDEESRDNEDRTWWLVSKSTDGWNINRNVNLIRFR